MRSMWRTSGSCTIQQTTCLLQTLGDFQVVSLAPGDKTFAEELKQLVLAHIAGGQPESHERVLIIDELKDEVYHFVFELLDSEYGGEKAGKIATEVSNYFGAWLSENP